MSFANLCILIVSVSFALWLLQAWCRRKKQKKFLHDVEAIGLGVVDKDVKITPDTRALFRDIANRLDRIDATPETEKELEDLQIAIDMIVNPKEYR